MSGEQSDTERLERDDSPPHGRHIPVASFETDCREAWSRVERKVDRVLGTQGRTATDVAVQDEKIKNLEKWRDEQMSNRSQFAVGMKIAVASAIGSPLVMLGIHLFTRHA
jgi:hypothetical protein